jgi:MerR family copper efflux transcriptional regulator
MDLGTGSVTMHIGELAEKTGLSLRTIRHYDEVGLLKPTGRTEGGFRLYTPEDFSRLVLIRRMKPLGFSLEEMTDLLRVIDALGGDDTSTQDPAVRRELDAFIGQADERRARLREQLSMADEFLALLRARQNEHQL